MAKMGPINKENDKFGKQIFSAEEDLEVPALSLQKAKNKLFSQKEFMILHITQKMLSDQLMGNIETPLNSISQPIKNLRDMLKNSE